MKKITLITFSVLLHFCTQAQQITFEKVIDTLGCKYADCIKETYDGGYIIAGVSYFNNNDAAIIKLDSLGYITWAKTYGGGGMDGLQRIEQLPDSGYMAMGLWNAGNSQKTWIMRFDVNGDTLWTKRISGGTYKNEPQGLISFSSFYAGVVGLYFRKNIDYDTYLLILDSLGAIQKFKTYGDSIYNNEGYEITKAIDNGFAITGSNKTSATEIGVYLIKTDINGDTIWTRNYFNSNTNGGYSIKQTNDSGFVIAGIIYDASIMTYHNYLIKTNADGDTIFTRVFYHPHGSSCNSVDIVDSTGYIIGGRIINPIPQLKENLLLLRTDPNGDTIWTRWYAGIGSAFGRYVVSTKDKGFICTGITGPAMYVIKTDSLGKVYTNIGINETAPKPEIEINPNPSSGLFYVKTNKINSSFTLTVSNSFGSVIKKENIHSCNDYCLVNMSDYSSGIYTISIQTDNNRIAQKVMLVK